MDRPVGADISRWEGLISGPRPGRMRDRRGRGPRGPMALPGPLSPRSVPAHRAPRAAFDRLVGDIVAALDHHFEIESDHVDLVVEEAPMLPPEWTDEVPLSILVPSVRGSRVVLFRMPITHRGAGSRDVLEDLVWSVILDRLSEVWHISPDDLDPRRPD
ncbi:metallopeptidase family protein [Aeromicrobium sp.]|uniref:metallopeptidase family protein n=1 Tax=Aeromicrobium sp. TaxID=1871063 RepID=UPI0019C8F627|nr:metallopeptidase family protein [Aeromicrobium sp.]MBC7632021.1 metallopeptidase family protein [Aeromicrobium sp.]